MPRTFRPTLLALVAILACFVLRTSAQGFQESYCSPYNTASDEVYSWDYQSNGNCTNHCKQTGSFAFAVIQYTDCYCSDYVPSPQQSIGDCHKDCPGYPAEKCGDRQAGLFIYIKLSGRPSGTKSAGGDSQLTSSAPAISNKPSPTPTPTPTPAPPTREAPAQTLVITESGKVFTKTVAPSSAPSTVPPPADDANSAPNVGAIAGGVAGGIIALLALIGILVFVLWRRRKQRQELEDGGNGGGSSGITRNTSTMSKAGLLGSVTDGDHPYRPQLATTFGTQSSRYGADNQSVSPISNRRNSQPLVIDSRMDPHAMIEYAGANASRESIGTIDDSRDYGRKLGVRNPDPSG